MSDNSNVFKYRACKSSWGIAIDVDAIKVSLADLSEDVIRIGECLAVDDSLNWLSEKERYFLIEGVMLANNISDVLEPNSVVLIKDIVFNFTDYQEEGLALAISGWLNQFMGVDVKEVGVEFDKENNKYLFFKDGEMSGWDIYGRSVTVKQKVPMPQK